MVLDPPLHFHLYSYSQTDFVNCRCQTRAQPEIFKSWGSFMKLEHFDEHFVRNTGKGSADKDFGVFFPRYS